MSNDMNDGIEICAWSECRLFARKQSRLQITPHGRRPGRWPMKMLKPEIALSSLSRDA